MRKKRILVIEDEQDLANMIKKYLIREHYEVELVVSGGAVAAAVDSVQPDLLILDIMLPEIDGLEILRNIRLTSSIPVIITSAKETELDRILGLKLGADDYLVKPFSIKEMVARVEALFRRIENYANAGPEKQVFAYQQFTIDQSAREIHIGTVPLRLTVKEFDVLLFLLQHPKQVVSKTQIYDQVWGVNEYGDMNTVTIHIQKIREKLGPSHQITTIRGIGYRFDGILL